MKNNVFIYANNGTNYHRDTILQFLLSGYMLNFISDKNLTNNFTSIETELLDSLITIKSDIVNNTEFEIILNFLPDKPKRVTKLYRGKEDGCNSTNFHSKCGDQGYTLSIIKSNLGYTFGGYTTKCWSGDGLIRDNESFVFSLDKKEKYKASHEDAGIVVLYNNVVDFFCTIVMYENCFNDSYSYTDKKPYLFSDAILQEGNYNFTPIDFEVFKIEY
jgi:hypothetical protein